MFRRIFRFMLNETDDFFKMLADSTRLRCLMLMQAEGELCVCELTHALNLSQPKISRHLAHLRDAGVLLARRNGTWMILPKHKVAKKQSWISSTLAMMISNNG